jgi:Synergist-CTERM protein sorting domain-containing protein
VLAGVALAEVGHITPIGHVDTIQLDWQAIQSDDVVLNDGASFSFLPQEEAPAGTGELGDLQLPEDKTYNLSLLGGIEAAISINPASAQGGPIETQLALAISGDLQIPNQNMLLLYNEATQKWDGYNDFSFFVEDGSSYDIDTSLIAVKIRVIGAKATEVTSCGGGGGGGCSVLGFAPAALFLLAPLFLLRKHG